MSELHAYPAKLLEVAPVFFAMLAVLEQQSALLNESWRAIHRLPFVKNEQRHPPAALWKRALAGVFIALYFTAAFIMPIFIEDEEKFLIASVCFFLPPMSWAVYNYCMNRVEGLNYGIKRANDGNPELVPQTTHKASKIATALVVAVSLCVSFASLWPWVGQPVALGFVFYTVITIVCVNKPIHEAQEMTLYIIIAFALVGLTIAFTVFEVIKNLRDDDSEPEATSTINSRKVNNLKWNELAMSVWYSSTLIGFMAMLYRFDSRHELSGEMDFFPTEDPEVIILPSNLWPTLLASVPKKPCFSAARRTLCVAFLFTTALSALGLVDSNMYNFITRMSIIALPAMLIVAIARAAWRGEWKKLVSYKENWKFVPEVKSGVKGGDGEKEKGSEALDKMAG